MAFELAAHLRFMLNGLKRDSCSVQRPTRPNMTEVFGGNLQRLPVKSGVERLITGNTRILEAVDRGLDVFGNGVRQAIYYHLEEKYGISRDEILSNPEKFAKGLENIFGSGTKIIEMHIINKINSEFGVSGSSLPDAMGKAESQERLD